MSHAAPTPEPGPGNAGSYRELDPREIVATARQLESRVRERFPDSSLVQVCAEMGSTVGETAELNAWLRRPHYWVRAPVGLLMVLMAFALVGGISKVPVRLAIQSAVELLQALESGVNDVVFVGLAVFFLAGWETRRKRARALKSLHQLRSLAHIVDMHQLTKDPERVMGFGSDTVSSPKRLMNAFELTRYLNYCSEMLSLISKAAALHVQGFEDTATLDAVEQIEDLTNGLSRKIWQKIMILDRIVAPEAPQVRTEPD